PIVGTSPTLPGKESRLRRRSIRVLTVSIHATPDCLTRKSVLHLPDQLRNPARLRSIISQNVRGKKGETMAYAFTNSKGVTYYLHTKKSTTSTGKERTLFFFSKEIKDGTLDAVPAGYQVVEMKTGLPVLKKAEGETETAAVPET